MGWLDFGLLKILKQNQNWWNKNIIKIIFADIKELEQKVMGLGGAQYRGSKSIVNFD